MTDKTQTQLQRAIIAAGLTAIPFGSKTTSFAKPITDLSDKALIATLLYGKRLFNDKMNSAINTAKTSDTKTYNETSFVTTFFDSLAAGNFSSRTTSTGQTLEQRAFSLAVIETVQTFWNLSDLYTKKPTQAAVAKKIKAHTAETLLFEFCQALKRKKEENPDLEYTSEMFQITKAGLTFPARLEKFTLSEQKKIDAAKAAAKIETPKSTILDDLNI